jgi:trafficking protein particle complex subunit 11
LTTQTVLENQPMLVNEFFKVTTNISNNFDVGLEKVFISVTIPDNLRNKGIHFKFKESMIQNYLCLLTAFLTTDLSDSVQKLSSHIQINIGDLQYQSTNTISYYVMCLIEGNVELKQRVWYQTENLYRATTTPQPTSLAPDASPTTNVGQIVAGVKPLPSNHNIQIIYLDEQMQKIREDTVVVPCTEEIQFSGRFYTLSRQALMRAYKNEMLLLRVNVELKAACDIDILAVSFISDHNIQEKSTRRMSRPLIGNGLKRGSQLEDILMLSPLVSSAEWVSKQDFLNKDAQLVFQTASDPLSAPPSRTGSFRKTDDQTGGVNRNLLSKIPSNATIVGSANPTSFSSALMTSSTSSLGDDKGHLNITADAPDSGGGRGVDGGDATLAVAKSIYKQAVDGVHLTVGDSRGFFRATMDETQPMQNYPAFGIYCVKWRRSLAKDVNESKFVINGIGE